MTILILSIVALGVLAAIGTIIANRGKDDDTPIHVEQTCATCDGTASTKCEQECMMEASTKPIEYFDDEELMPSRAHLRTLIRTKRWKSLPTCSTPCGRTRWRLGAEASTCAASNCPTS